MCGGSSVGTCQKIDHFSVDTVFQACYSLVMVNNKPYHLMTAGERLAARVAQNKIIDEKVEAAVRAKVPIRQAMFERQVQRVAGRFFREACAVLKPEEQVELASILNGTGLGSLVRGRR